MHGSAGRLDALVVPPVHLLEVDAGGGKAAPGEAAGLLQASEQVGEVVGKQAAVGLALHAVRGQFRTPAETGGIVGVRRHVFLTDCGARESPLSRGPFASAVGCVPRARAPR